MHSPRFRRRSPGSGSPKISKKIFNHFIELQMSTAQFRRSSSKGCAADWPVLRSAVASAAAWWTQTLRSRRPAGLADRSIDSISSGLGHPPTPPPAYQRRRRPTVRCWLVTSRSRISKAKHRHRTFAQRLFAASASASPLQAGRQAIIARCVWCHIDGPGPSRFHAQIRSLRLPYRIMIS